LRLRLQSQLLIVMIAILSALTVISLLVVRQTVEKQVQLQTLNAATASVRAFDRLQLQELGTLSRTAAMMAELPPLKAMMATEHPATIQDASKAFWDLSGSDLLILFDRSSKVMALHASRSDFPTQSVKPLLRSFGTDKEDVWWQDASGLYRVVIRPVTAGSGSTEQGLGIMLLGLRINDAVASEIGRLAGTDVVLSSATHVIASTLQNVDESELADRFNPGRSASDPQPHEVEVNGRKYEAASILLQAGNSTVRCDMLLPLDQASAFVAELNKTILIVALVVAALGAVLLRLVASAITRPLELLNSAVKALASGDSTYRLSPEGSVEVEELATAFSAMRQDLSEARRRELEAERLAALGRVASSISHDLRHHLAALVANAEFLHDAEEMGFNKDEIYKEIQRASEEMTQLIESLLEVSREHRTLTIAEEDLSSVVQHVIETVKANPEYRGHRILLQTAGDTRGSVDRQKLERALFNLLLNACQAVNEESGQITIKVEAVGDQFECRISDNGPGIPNSVHDTLFQPFVSAGKNNGTGLGLTIARRILQDHEGEIMVEESSSSGTTFLLRFPRRCLRRSDAEGLSSATVGG
jgi:signal transduction histidine kinase